VARLDDSQNFVGGSGATPVVTADAGQIVAGVVATLSPREQAEWRIVVKAGKAGDARFSVDLEADQFFCPVRKTEVTIQN
jgi:hypothetical protein